MATARTTITLSEEAFKLLKKFKAPGDTYSDVILEHMDRPPARTAGELLKRLEEIEGQPIVNPELMAKDDSAVALAVKRYEERLRRNSAGDRGQFERVCQLCNVEM